MNLKLFIHYTLLINIMVLIGIMGKKGSGKDTVSDYLVANYQFHKLAFADPIKQVAQIMFDFNEQQLNGEFKETIDKRWGISPREVFQKLGTEFGQFDLPKYFPTLGEKVNRNFWVERLKIEYYKLPKNSNVIVSDVRFNHEIEEIKKMGGKIIYIERNDRIWENQDSHLSEKEMEKLDRNLFDIRVDNNDCKQKLFDNINKLIPDLINR